MLIFIRKNWHGHPCWFLFEKIDMAIHADFFSEKINMAILADFYS